MAYKLKRCTGFDGSNNPIWVTLDEDALTLAGGGTVTGTTNFSGTIQIGGVTMNPTAWTAVTFQNAWANFGGSHQVCQYRKIGDMVYVRGLLAGGATNTAAFTLPSGFRPPADVIFAAEQQNEVHARITVTSAGVVTPRFGAGGTNGYLSCNFAFSTST